MADSKIQEKAIALGRRLVHELDRAGEGDMLTRWMAHYIGERIAAAETATGTKKLALQQQCCDAILALWEKRNSLPDGLRPLEPFEPIFRVLAALDLEKRSSYYIGSVRRGGKPPANRREKEADLLVDFVLTADQAARTLIELGLEAAVEAANTKPMRAMLEAARALNSGHDLELARQLLAYHDPDERSRHLAREVERLESRLATLDRFRELCEQVRPAFEARLEKARRAEQKSLAKQVVSKRSRPQPKAKR